MDDTGLKTKRFGANFWIIIAAVLGIGLGSIGTWQFLDHYVKTPTPVELAFPRKISTTSVTSASTDPNAGYQVIPEFGIRFKTNSALAGLTYLYKSNSGSPVVYFSTVALTNADPNCGADKTSIGAVSQYKAGDMYFDKPIEQNSSAHKIGSYYYLYEHPQAACSNNDSTNQKAATVVAALQSSSASLEAAK